MKNTSLIMPDRNLDYEKISNDMSQWISDTAHNAGLENLVIGVSGGVDSAVVSTIAAMSGKTLTALELPIHQKNDEVSRAREHIKWLQGKYTNVVSELIDLSSVYDSMKALQSSGNSPESEYLSDVNMRSRLRAVQLYATGNRKQGLIMGTGNKVEDYGIGFFTKFGDGAVDMSPIGELYKSEVYKLAATLGIHPSILNARPTDGLHPNGATDEDQIGCTYDELEWAMVEYDKGKRVENFKGRAREVMEIYIARHEGNAHKMVMPPVFKLEV